VEGVAGSNPVGPTISNIGEPQPLEALKAKSGGLSFVEGSQRTASSWQQIPEFQLGNANDLIKLSEASKIFGVSGRNLRFECKTGELEAGLHPKSKQAFDCHHIVTEPVYNPY
jgi:hypothetical protein